MPEDRSAHTVLILKNRNVNLCLNQSPIYRIYNSCACLEAHIDMQNIKEDLLLIIMGHIYQIVTMR